MARLFGCTSIDAGIKGSLKEIDPLDCYGDGSNVALVVGDRAVLPHYWWQMVFFSLEEASGHTDDDIEEVIPSKNAGDLYWKCRGATKESFSASAGEEFKISVGGAIFAPEGFTLSEIPYSELNYTYFGKPSTSDSYNYPAFGIWNDNCYCLKNNDLWKQSKFEDDGVLISVPEHAWGGNNVNSAHCSSIIDGSEAIISEVVLASMNMVVHRFHMDTETYSSIPVLIPSDSNNFLSVYGDTTLTNGLRIGKWHYLFGGGWSIPRTGATRIDVLTGKLEELTPIPDPGVNEGIMCPDYLDNGIFIMSKTGELYKYDIENDDWETLAVCPNDIDLDTNHVSWFDEPSETILVPLNGEGLWIYDTSLDEWSIEPNIKWNFNTYVFGYNFYYRDFGVVCPLAWTPFDEFYHAIIPANKCTRITKD